MKILLVNVPSRKGKGGFFLPIGLLYVGGILERSGHSVRVEDPYLEDPDLCSFDVGTFERICRLVDEFQPEIIGYGGIATSYGRTKRLSLHLKKIYPHLLQIAGGALASTCELLLTRSAVDVVFHGETEESLPVFLERLERGMPTRDIAGISFFDGGTVRRNPPARQVENLDDVPYPAYHLVDVPAYFQGIDDWQAHYRTGDGSRSGCADVVKWLGQGNQYLPLATSRGCTHRCFFCYRHVRGIRRHSVSYVVGHMKHLQQTYGIEGFQFADELFNSDPEWVLSFCDALENAQLDIFYLVAGARADKIDKTILRRLKETGCIEINYGQESGSETILEEMRKGVSRSQNREITLLTKEMGIHCPVQIVIGSPSETDETIDETVEFLKEVEAWPLSLNYLIPLPETPSWRYVEERSLIDDPENYLDRVAESGGLPLVNLTRVPDGVWATWSFFIRAELELHRAGGGGMRWYVLFRRTFYRLARTLVFLIPFRVLQAMRRLRRAASVAGRACPR